MARKIFINMPVKSLERAKQFWTSLGFAFNPQFTDEKAACMVFSEDGFAMLLAEPFFRSFTTKAPCDTSTHSEALFAFSCDSRAEVDALLGKALAGGATEAGAPMDHGFMYQRSFYDLDQHHWEVLWMDPGHVQ